MEHGLDVVDPPGQGGVALQHRALGFDRFAERQRARLPSRSLGEDKWGSVPNGIKLSGIMDGFGWAVSMGQVAHFMTRASELIEKVILDRYQEVGIRVVAVEASD